MKLSGPMILASVAAVACASALPNAQPEPVPKSERAQNIELESLAASSQAHASGLDVRAGACGPSWPHGCPGPQYAFCCTKKCLAGPGHCCENEGKQHGCKKGQPCCGLGCCLADQVCCAGGKGCCGKKEKRDVADADAPVHPIQPATEELHDE